MYTVKELAKALRLDPQRVYRAMRLLEVYQDKEFSKEGKSYLFNDQEKQIVQDVVENGVKAAKPKRANV
jgi:hypothetical protein